MLKLKLPLPLKSGRKQVVNCIQLLYRTVNSVYSDEKTFNCSKCSRRMLFLCYFSTQINFRRVFKVSAFGTQIMHVLSRDYHWSIDASFVR